MSGKAELEEIAHTGGQATFTVSTDSEGRRSYNVEWRHARPTPAAVFGVYAIRQGVACGDLDIGGPWKNPPIPACYPVFISSDTTGKFGHQCPSCKGYWRADHGGKICPYCAFEGKENFEFLTDAQRRYVKQYCDRLTEALSSEKDGEYVIDMDAVAEAAAKDCEKPPFYYAEERQQNEFECDACGEVNDVLGTYAYCGSCGTRNDLQEFKKFVQGLRQRINTGGPYEIYVKEAVAAFDSFAGHYAKQLVARIPLTPGRKRRVERSHFHTLGTAADLFKTIFDVDVLSGVNQDDAAFATLMFHRRHVYEHKGGEADEKYISDSGDTVRLKQALRESQDSAHHIVNIVLKLATNLHTGFHEIFPPLDEPIQWHSKRKTMK